jgi:hypothetical protein
MAKIEISGKLEVSVPLFKIYFYINHGHSPPVPVTIAVIIAALFIGFCLIGHKKNKGVSSV